MRSCLEEWRSREVSEAKDTRRRRGKRSTASTSVDKEAGSNDSSSIRLRQKVLPHKYQEAPCEVAYQAETDRSTQTPAFSSLSSAPVDKDDAH